TATYTVTAGNVSDGHVTNIATVSADAVTGADPSDEATATTTIHNADLSVLKTVSSTSPPVGGTVTFEITVINNGPSDATDVHLIDVVPNGYADITDLSDDGELEDDEIHWMLALAKDETVTVSYRAKVLPAGDGISHRNSVTVENPGLNDPDPGNNAADV